MFTAAHIVKKEDKTEAKIDDLVYATARLTFFAAPTPIAKKKPLKKKKILVVDDVAINRKLLVRMLADYECVQACDGQEAVNEVKKSLNADAVFDFILMDLEMPIMDGNSAASAIRNLNGRVPIICISSIVSNQENFELLTPSMDDFLSKPVKEVELASVLKNRAT